MKRTVVGAGMLVAIVALGLALVAVGGVGATTQAEETTENNGTFGAEISSFMQASSAQAEGEVDDGMFDAAMNRTDDPEERQALVERRQERLEQRQARLEERRAGIGDGDGPSVRDHAVATHVTVGASSLERSANGTARAAEAAGMDTEALNEIRSNARNLRGSGVAELARNVSGGPSAGERGPPIDVGGSDDAGPDAPGTNRSSERGGPDDVGPGGESDNASGGGSADEAPGQSGDDEHPGEDDDAGAGDADEADSSD